MQPYDLEAVYDDKIAPLMAEIIALCKEHDMPMLASFVFRGHEDGGHDLCTTALLEGNRRPPKALLRAAWAILYEGA